MPTAAEIAERFGFTPDEDPVSTVLLGGDKLRAAHPDALTAAYVESEHPRDPGGEGGGQWIRAPGRGFGLGPAYKLKEDQIVGRPGGVAQATTMDLASREVLKGTKDTQQLYKDEKARYGYTRDRVRDFQDPAIAHFLSEGMPGQARPETLFLSGGSGSGKSTVLGKLGLAPVGSVLVNPDSIKELMPEYKTLVEQGSTYAAAATHEESSDVSKRLLGQVVAGDYNAVVDGTGDSGIGKFVGKIEAQQNLGRKVRVTMVDIPTEEAIRRADARASDPSDPGFGRYIDHGEIRKIHQAVAANHEIWRNTVDDWEVYSNDDGPRLIARRVGGGPIEVLDASRYQQVLDKGRS